MVKMPAIKMPTLNVGNILSFRREASHLIGVDIGHRSLKIAGFSLGQEPCLLFYSITDIPEKDKDVYIQETIRKVVKENDFPSKEAVLSFSDESILFRRIELPAMPQKEIADALRWKSNEVIHYDASSASIDFHILSEFQKEDGSKAMELIFAAVSNVAISERIKIIKDAGMSVVGVNLPPFGVESALEANAKIAATGLIVVIDMGHAKTEVSIFKDKALDFVRSIPLGSGGISDSMQGSAVSSDKGEVTLSYQEAEDLKRNLGISYEEVKLDSGISSRQILSLMRPVLERLSKEIKRSIDYYTREFSASGEMEAYIIGGGSRLKNLDRYLGEELNMATKRMALSDFVSVPKSAFNEEDAPSLIALAGMALGHDRHLSLLPHEYRSEKTELMEKVSIRVFSILMASILAVSFLFTRIRVEDYKNRLKTAPFQKAVLEQVRELQNRVLERQAIMDAAGKTEVKADRIMMELSTLIPPDTVLNSLSITAKDRSLTMQGAVYGPKASVQPALTKFMEDLEGSNYFKEAQLTSLQSEKGDSNGSSVFELICLLE